ncbi:hypothetical protein BABINDRAFT_160125 [Babjeviella inositovora NRRL Y-12698]|uniref:Uncharacterized protein n=1 Tax=Babjeviella inositovora NRRL Y-12698 TaxID=984486 RepID=A0A1E3QW49_9ASCO|nr:uncharacterized protein BABINDRAFT_160125 [Babjeviella inositovora NRRL Y-12698]ODQ81893.1 hypothetical protein BABINDRAFT_160125 [Babjeviella inositovora NRRL Y-12698]
MPFSTYTPNTHPRPFKLVYSAKRGYIRFSQLHPNEEFSYLPALFSSHTAHLLLYLVSKKCQNKPRTHRILLPSAWYAEFADDPFFQLVRPDENFYRHPKATEYSQEMTKSLLKFRNLYQQKPTPLGRTSLLQYRIQSVTQRFVVFPELEISSSTFIDRRSRMEFVLLGAKRFREMVYLPMKVQALTNNPMHNTGQTSLLTSVVADTLVRYTFLLSYATPAKSVISRDMNTFKQCEERRLSGSPDFVQEMRYFNKYLIISWETDAISREIENGIIPIINKDELNYICSLDIDSADVARPSKRQILLQLKQTLRASFNRALRDKSHPFLKAAAKNLFGIGIRGNYVCLALMNCGAQEEDMHIIRVFNLEKISSDEACIGFAQNVAMFIELSRREMHSWL